jgi:CASC3/Barentsz eIF4AIII binding
MSSQRRKDLLQQRRRVRSNETYDDSASEASLPTDVDDDDADADYSDLSEGDVPETSGSDGRRKKSKHTRPHRPMIQKSSSQPLVGQASKSQQPFQAVKDTEVMLNGLSISDNEGKIEQLDFDSLDKNSDPQPSEPVKAKPDTPSDKKIRDNEEYKRKLESDPAFIPTRGAFFMHDHRSASQGHNGFRGARGGRGGRGRNGGIGPFSPSM